VERVLCVEEGRQGATHLVGAVLVLQGAELDLWTRTTMEKL
jgi:hypothetical protein